MSKQLHLLFLLFIALNSREQDKTPHPGFGEGIITIRQYFCTGGLVPDNPDLLSPDRPFYEFTYYVKGDKILRKDRKDEHDSTEYRNSSTSMSGGVQTTLKAQIVHPNYLIDWKRKMVYTFFKKNGKRQISQEPLKDEYTELFYRLIDSNNTAIKTIDTGLSFLIAGKKCFKGVASKNGNSITFYYTTEPLKAYSPLNGFASSDFPDQVLKVECPTDDKDEYGKPKGVIVFQVMDIKECRLEDSLFDLPGNVQIRKNVPWEELYSGK